MSSILRWRVQLGGTPIVGPGVATFHTLPGIGASVPAALQAFWTTVKDVMAHQVTVQVSHIAEAITVETGEITGTQVFTAQTALVGASSQEWVPGVGTRIKWQTDSFVAGRRVKGATFVVPLGRTAYESAGAITAGVLSTLQGAAEDLITDLEDNLVIYSRPTTEHAGAASVVVGAAVPDAVSWLRSRRT